MFTRKSTMNGLFPVMSAIMTSLLVCGNLLADETDDSKGKRFHQVVEENVAHINRRFSPEEMKAMSDKRFPIRPIGVFHSPLTPKTGAPRQGRLAPEIKATIEVFPEFEKCCGAPSSAVGIVLG